MENYKQSVKDYIAAWKKANGPVYDTDLRIIDDADVEVLVAFGDDRLRLSNEHLAGFSKVSEQLDTWLRKQQINQKDREVEPE